VIILFFFATNHFTSPVHSSTLFANKHNSLLVLGNLGLNGTVLHYHDIPQYSQKGSFNQDDLPQTPTELLLAALQNNKHGLINNLI
jgi:hypothetical protein